MITSLDVTDEEVLASITKDEAAHARFGWLFFDWAESLLADEERAQLPRRAAECIAAHCRRRERAPVAEAEAGLGWMSPRQFREAAPRVMESVCEPLRERGLLPVAPER